MNDTQFDIMDELYFVISFDDLKSKLDIKDFELSGNLKEMILKGWVKCFEQNAELEKNEISFEDKVFRTYNFLATKKGLFEHNSR